MHSAVRNIFGLVSGGLWRGTPSRAAPPGPTPANTPATPAVRTATRPSATAAAAASPVAPLASLDAIADAAGTSQEQDDAAGAAHSPGSAATPAARAAEGASAAVAERSGQGGNDAVAEEDAGIAPLDLATQLDAQQGSPAALQVQPLAGSSPECAPPAAASQVPAEDDCCSDSNDGAGSEALTEPLPVSTAAGAVVSPTPSWAAAGNAAEAASPALGVGDPDRPQNAPAGNVQLAAGDESDASPARPACGTLTEPAAAPDLAEAAAHEAPPLPDRGIHAAGKGLSAPAAAINTPTEQQSGQGDVRAAAGVTTPQIMSAMGSPHTSPHSPAAAAFQTPSQASPSPTSPPAAFHTPRILPPSPVRSFALPEEAADAPQGSLAVENWLQAGADAAPARCAGCGRA